MNGSSRSQNLLTLMLDKRGGCTASLPKKEMTLGLLFLTIDTRETRLRWTTTRLVSSHEEWYRVESERPVVREAK